MLYFPLGVRKQPDCRGGFGTVSARLRESKAQWPTFTAACLCVWVGERVRVSLSMCASVCVHTCVSTYICRENLSTVAGFGRSSATDTYVSVVFCRSRCSRRCFVSAFWSRLGTDGNIWGIILPSMSVVAWQLEARRQLAIVAAAVHFYVPQTWNASPATSVCSRGAGAKPAGQMEEASKLTERFSLASLVSLLASSTGCLGLYNQHLWL